MKLRIKNIAYHRNGISGAGFHVVRFADEERPNMLACVFEEPGVVAVLDLDNLTDCWRGDHYEAALRKAIEPETCGCGEPMFTLADGTKGCPACEQY